MNKDEVPPKLVVDVKNEEVNEEPASLIRISSKKPVIPKPKRESSMKNVEVKNVEGKKFGENSSDKYEKKEKM